MREWSEQETACLREKYPTTKPKLLCKLLPNRSLQAIYKKAADLGLHRIKQRNTPEICNDCKISLTNKNWYPSAKQHGSYICKKCLNKRVIERRRNAKPLTNGKCRYCDATLTPNNWSLWNRKSRYYCCIKCSRKQARKKYQRRKHIIRETLITTKVNGKTVQIRTNKRPYTNICEVCGKKAKTQYHHWNKQKPHWGLWVCWKCHMLAEGIDYGGLTLADKYLKLKTKVESNWTTER